MKMFLIFRILSLFLVLLLTNSLDVSTLSNYKGIPINSISGEFKPDFDKKIVYGNLKYKIHTEKSGNQIIFDTSKLNIKNVYKIIN